MAGNPNIAEIGKSTRFGAPGGTDPKKARRAASEPWSIRNAVRRIAAMDIADFKDMTAQPGNLTLAQAVAARKFERALKGDVRAMQQLEDSIDGKLTEKSAQAHATLADLVNGSFENDE